MRAGKLRHLATIQSNAPTRTDSGEAQDVWSTHTTAWIELAQVKGGEVYRGRQVHAEADSVARLRYQSGITPRMRMVFGDRTFDIVAVNNVAGVGRELVIDLKERGL